MTIQERLGDALAKKIDTAIMEHFCQYLSGTDCTIRLRNETCLLESGKKCDENEAE